VRTRVIDGGRPRGVSAPVRVSSRRPYSAYNAVLAPGGSAVAYETAQSTYPAGKRVGQMSVHVRDLRTGEIERISHVGLPKGAAARSAYNPSMSANGRLVAFEATDTPRGRGATSHNGLWIFDRARQTQRLVTVHGSDGAAFLPRLSGDGTAIAYTDVAPGGDGSTQVYVRALRGGGATLVSRRSGARGEVAAGDAYDPAISHDGSTVAFVTRAANLGRAGNASRVYVRDLRTGATDLVSATVGGDAITPSLSRDGRFVAFVERRRAKRVDPANLRSEIWLHDRRTGTTTLVSRAPGAAGEAAGGYSSEPAVSADGARVAFTSTAGNLAAAKPGGLAGVFVRDLRRSTTTLLSERGTTSTQPAVQEAPPLNTAYVCPLEPWHEPQTGDGARTRKKVAGALQPLVPTALAPPPSRYLSG
jgi:Tol biopolymer transport system component